MFKLRFIVFELHSRNPAFEWNDHRRSKRHMQCQKWGKYFEVEVRPTSCFWAVWPFQMFTGPLLQINSTFTKYCLTQWMSKFPGSFEILWVKQCLVNFTGLAGIVHATVYKTKLIFTGLRHGKIICESMSSDLQILWNNSQSILI